MSEALRHSRALYRLLLEAVNVDRSVRRELNAIAEGQTVVCGPERETLTRISRAIRKAIEMLGRERVDAPRIEDRSEVLSIDRDILVPQALREAYEMLYYRTYGTGAGARIVSERAEAVAGRKGRIARPERAGPTASTRTVVRDHQSFGFKRRVDKRLRKIAGEINLFLAGGGDARVVKRCEGCGRMGEDEWTYCPRCGRTLKTE